VEASITTTPLPETLIEEKKTATLTPIVETPDRSLQPVSKAEVASWILIASALFLIFYAHLVAPLVIGLAFYLVIDRISQSFGSRVSRKAVRFLAVIAGVALGIAIVAGAIAIIVQVARAQMANVPALMTKMADILESTRLLLIRAGGYVFFPDALRDAEDLKATVVRWLKAHSAALGFASERIGSLLVYGVMSVFLATLVFLRHIRHEDDEPRGALSHHLVEKIGRFAEAFARVVSAQFKISAINTTLTAIYVLAILPLFGKSLPFGVTIVFITFVCGLIPVLGNLISNSVIVVVSLGLSPGTAIASLAFLVLIHKLEYLVNSKIVGKQTDSEAWEILASIIVGDAAFGIPGIVMGPIIYTFAKRELRERGLV
jgi:predicted PurR-regulated permease PerM